MGHGVWRLCQGTSNDTCCTRQVAYPRQAPPAPPGQLSDGAPAGAGQSAGGRRNHQPQLARAAHAKWRVHARALPAPPGQLSDGAPAGAGQTRGGGGTLKPNWHVLHTPSGASRPGRRRRRPASSPMERRPAPARAGEAENLNPTGTCRTRQVARPRRRTGATGSSQAPTRTRWRARTLSPDCHMPHTPSGASWRIAVTTAMTRPSAPKPRVRCVSPSSSTGRASRLTAWAQPTR